MARPHWLLRLPILVLLGSASLRAAPVDFVRDVRPILEKHCHSCHGAEKQKSGLRLDVRAEALRGGDAHAPAIRPGKAEASPLLEFVRQTEGEMMMPPKGPRLTPAEVDVLDRWIQEGALWPDGVDTAKVVDKRDHWAFKPLTLEQAPPSLDLPGQRNGIDAFVAAKLGEKGLTLSPEADRRTLIRRLYLVLHGLPPTPAEVAAFEADADPRAYEKLVDRLLDSPRYGERWARHWLDVIAFGETHGFEVNTPRPNAWPYRDYVIHAFNKDTPYPRFIMEQLAGDALGVDAATGFMVASAALLPGQIGKDEESKARARQDELADMVSTAGGAFLGLTLHCARCHDHKFDPVTQADYYGLQAIFAGVRHGERPATSPEMKHQQESHAVRLARLHAATFRMLKFEPDAGAAPRPPVNPLRNMERFEPVLASAVRFTVGATSENNRYEPCLDELEVYNMDGRNVALAGPGVKTSASGSWNSSRHRLEHLNDGQYGNERSWISTTKGGGWAQVNFARAEEVAGVVWGRDRLGALKDRLPVVYRVELLTEKGVWQEVASSTTREKFANPEAKPRPVEPAEPALLPRWHEARGELAALEGGLQTMASGPMVYAGKFEQPGPSYRLNRGDVTQPREEAPPGAVAAVGPPLKLPSQTPEQKRRAALANWLASPENPLPARVLVNRLWQHQFGEPIVATPNDFGRNGAAPSHPELLDWLAAEFIRAGWSIKHMQRLIVTSATWRQSSAPRSEGLAADSQTRLLWRYPPSRVDAEVLRDQILAVAGTLDLRMGGPGFSVFAPNNNYVRVYDPRAEFGPEEWRRMIYVTKVRMAQDATFGAFDCPDAGQSQPKRPRSTTAIQALSLFNSHFVNQQAALMAARLKKEAGDDPAKQIQRAFALTFQRLPDAAEKEVCGKLVQDHGMAALCRVLLNSNEFLFVP